MTAHKNLGEALVAFQSEAPTLTKDSTNPHFRSKFVSLDNIVETVQPLLAKHGLAWSALPCMGPNGEPALRYQLLHAATGEALSDVMPLLLAKQDSQGQGSALTYARRYSLSAVLNLVADADDDGEANKGHAKAPAAKANGNGEVVTEADIAALKLAAKGLTFGNVKMVLTACGIAQPGEGAEVFGHVPRVKAAVLREALAEAKR